MRIAIKVKWLDGTLTNTIITPEYVTFDGFYFKIHFQSENVSFLRFKCSESYYRVISDNLLNNSFYKFLSETAFETLMDEEDSDGSCCS